jgi:hypothetical protein
MPKKGNQPLQAMFATLSSILQKRFLNNHSEMKPPTLESKTALHVKQVLLLFTQEQPSVDKKIANRHADPAESGSQVSDKGEVVNETRIWEIVREQKKTRNAICAAWSARDHTENPSHKDNNANDRILRTTYG